MDRISLSTITLVSLLLINNLACSVKIKKAKFKKEKPESVYEKVKQVKNKERKYIKPLRGNNVAVLDFVGDISFDSAVEYYQKTGSCSYNKTLEHVTSYLKQSDIAIGNLESSFITPDMEPYAQSEYKSMLGVGAQAVEALKFAGFDIVGLANNHLNDYGDKPVNCTIDVLNRAGILPFGFTFGTIKENLPQKPVIMEINYIKIGFLGYCSCYGNEYDIYGKQVYYCIKKRKTLNLKAGPALYDEMSVTRDVTNLKSKVDVVVVMMHWGIEYYTTPTENQLKEAKFLQKLGVDIVVGCHPHVLEGHSISGSKLVSYSLGNFLFGPRDLNKHFYRHRHPTKNTLERLEKYLSSAASTDPTFQTRILRVKVSKKGVRGAAYLPLRIQFNTKSKCLQPTPLVNAKWISICSADDQSCLKH